MTRFAILIAPFDEMQHSHGGLRRRALERLGWDVTCINLLGSRGGGRWWRRRGWERSLAQAVEKQPDLVLAIGAPEVEADTIAAMRTRGSMWVNWFPDSWSADTPVDHAGHYDLVYAGGSDVADRLEAVVGRAVPVLPAACDPSVFWPNPERGQQYRANVVFAGRATRRRELLLAQLVEFGLALWGPGWRETALRDYCRGEAPSTEEFVRAYAGASVAVNIHHRPDDDDTVGVGCNQRVFEIAGIGVPQVVDARVDLPRWFTPGQDLVAFTTAAELRSAVEALLHDPARGEALGAAARARMLREHTYMHRLTALVEAALTPR